MIFYVLNLRKLKRNCLISVGVICLILVFALLYHIVGESLDYISASTPEDSISGIVVLDAGHGGEDPGAVGVGGILEKDLNMQIVQALAEELQSKGFVVVLTRSSDKLLYNENENIKGMRKIYDLKNRCKIANSHPEAIFLSIHMNSFADSVYKGLQVYYSDNNTGSQALAKCIQSEVAEQVQTDNTRAVKNGKGLYLLDHSEPVAVLVECGFITNQEDCKNLSEKEYQKRLSFSIVCGIIKYIEMNSNENDTTFD